MGGAKAYFILGLCCLAIAETLAASTQLSAEPKKDKEADHLAKRTSSAAPDFQKRENHFPFRYFHL